MKNKRSILKTMFLLLPLTVIASPLAAKDKTVTSPNGRHRHQTMIETNCNGHSCGGECTLAV